MNKQNTTNQKLGMNLKQRRKKAVKGASVVKVLQIITTWL